MDKFAALCVVVAALVPAIYAFTQITNGVI